MQKAQTLDEEYDNHKDTVIALGKIILEGQNIEKEFGAIKEHLLAMIRILIQKNIPNKQIRKILYRDCDGYCSDRYIRKVCVIANVQETDDENGTVPLLDSSDSSREVCADKPYAIQRNQLIKFNEDIQGEAKANVDELILDDVHIIAELDDDENEIKKGDSVTITRNWATFFDSDQVNSEFFKLITDMFYNNKAYDWKQVRDARQTILPKMRLPIFAFKSLVMNKHFCSRYFAHIKRASTITTKKLSQFISDVQSLSDLLHFVNEDGWKWNFIDVKCPMCRENSLKTRMLADGTWIFVCQNYEVHVTERTYPSSLLGSRLNQLYKNKNGAAAKYLSAKGITTPRD